MEGWSYHGFTQSYNSSEFSSNSPALTASQKMLVASLVAVMVLTLLFWGRYAGTAEMEPVLDQSLKSEEMSANHHAISRKGIPYKVVRRPRASCRPIARWKSSRTSATAALAAAIRTARMTRSSSEINPFEPADTKPMPHTTRQRRGHARPGHRPISRRSTAGVIIEPTNERRLEGSAATGRVCIRSRRMTGQRQAAGRSPAADAVAHAQVGADARKISVIINGCAYKCRDYDERPAASMAIDGTDDKLEAEHGTQKIRDQFSVHRRLLVSRAGDVDHSTVDSRQAKRTTKDDIRPRRQKKRRTDREKLNAAPPSASPGEGEYRTPVRTRRFRSAQARRRTAETDQNQVTSHEDRDTSRTTRTPNHAGRQSTRCIRAVRVPRSLFRQRFTRLKNPNRQGTR